MERPGSDPQQNCSVVQIFENEFRIWKITLLSPNIVALSTLDDAVILYNYTTKKIIRKIVSQDAFILDMCKYDKKYLLVGTYHFVGQWNYQTGRHISSTYIKYGIETMAPISRFVFAAGCGKGRIFIYSSLSRRLIRLIRNNSGHSVTSLMVLPRCQIMSGNSKSGIYINSTTTGQVLQHIQCEAYAVRRLNAHQIIACGKGQYLFVIDQSKKLKIDHKIQTDEVLSLQIVDRERFIVGTCKGTLLLFRLETNSGVIKQVLSLWKNQVLRMVASCSPYNGY